MGFIEWLEQQMAQRHWQNSDLARAAGINPSTLARILSRQRNAGPDTCKGLARALNMTQEGIFRRAGLLDPLPPPIVDENEIVRTIRSLGTEARQAALAMLRGLAVASPPLIPLTVSEPPTPYDATQSRLIDELGAAFNELPDADQNDIIQLLHETITQRKQKTTETKREQ